MRKSIHFLGLAVMGAAALLLPLSAHAICSSSVEFGSYYTKVINSTGPNSPTLRSNFWAFDATNPTSTVNGANVALNQGVDNGNLAELGTSGNWLRDIPALGGIVLAGDWSGANWDGCLDPVVPIPNQRMAVSFSDVDPLGKPTYAVACVQRLPSEAPQFGFDHAGAAIALVPAPKAITTNWVRSGVNEATITVAPPNFAAGFYSDGSSGCTAATVIPQYDVYKQQIARDGVPNPTTDTGANWVLVATGNAGAPASFTTTCGATNCDLYLAVVPHFQGNFSTAEAATGSPARIGEASVKLQAGPTLAVTPGRGNKKINNIGGTKSQQ